MSTFYERVAAASGVDEATVKKVLSAAAYCPSDSDRAKLPPFVVIKCPCKQKSCASHALNVGNFYQGCGWDEPTAQEIARRVNNHYPLVGALRGFVLLGHGSKVNLPRLVNENGRIALASAGET